MKSLADTTTFHTVVEHYGTFSGNNNLELWTIVLVSMLYWDVLLPERQVDSAPIAISEVHM